MKIPVILASSTFFFSVLSAANYSCGLNEIGYPMQYRNYYENTYGRDNRDQYDNYRDQNVRYYQGRDTRDNTVQNTAYGAGSTSATTEQPSADYAADQELMNRIRSTIEKDGTFEGYRNVNVRVMKGVVTLTGSVDRESDRQQLKNKIRSVNGVRDIQDNLQINDASRRQNQNVQNTEDYRNTSRTSYGDSRNQQNYNQQRSQNQSNQNYYDQNQSRTQDQTQRTAYDKNSEVVSDADIKSDVQDALDGGVFKKKYNNVTFDVQNGNVILRGTVATEEDHKDVIKRVNDVDGVRRVDDQVRVANTPATR